MGKDFGEKFEDFCGGRFWDLNLTWNTKHPDFTECFQRTVVAWIPCAFLWILMPLYVSYLCKVPGTSIPNNRLNLSKTVLSVLLVVLALADVGKAVYNRKTIKDQPLAVYITPAILAATYLLTVIFVQAERRKGFITSGILSMFWFLAVICGIVPFHSKIFHWQKDGPPDDTFTFVTFYALYALILAQFVLVCFADKAHIIEGDKKVCPEVKASFFSRITFWWINSLCFLGYSKTLEEGDLWSLHPRDLTRTTYPDFDRAWREELRRTHWYEEQEEKRKKVLASRNGGVTSSTGHHDNDLDDNESAPLLGGGSGRRSYGHQEQPSVDVVSPSDKKKKKKTPSLFRALTKIGGWTLFRAHLCKLICDLLTFVGPTLQRYLIQFTEDEGAAMWKGYLFASLFFVSAVANSFFFHQLFHIGMTLGMRIKAIVIAAVYQKALTMNSEARKTSTVGEIVNLMSVDAQRLEDVTGYLWMIWSSPFQIALAIYLLWGIMGPSVLAGLGVMVLLVPINGYIANIQRKLQVTFMEKKDARIKLMNEVLNGMKVLKLYAWEKSFEDKVTEIRDQELEILRKFSYLGGIGTFTWTCAPFMVMLATFTTYVLTGNVLDATTAFTSLSLFNILRFPINILPMMLAYLVTASVSIKRIGEFLQNGDLDDDSVQHNTAAAHPVMIQNGLFAWGTEQDDLPILKNIDINIPDGKLVAVVGQVGAGKSSLVSACLGEMVKLRGNVNVRGSVAYVAQQAWIQNATLKDNILFSREMDPVKYDKILDACALRPDLDILPGGDMTEIGEKGINLSGGQKQRVSLARAIYQDSDIYFLDDPLSAVDSHVGKHIFEKVVGHDGILKHKTRVLVTHGVHWLPKVDQVIVMVNGEVSEVGSYEELLSHDGPFAQFLKEHLTREPDSDEEEDDQEIQQIKSAILQRVDSVCPSEESRGAADADRKSVSSTEGSRKLRRRRSRRDTESSDKRGLSRQVSRVKSHKTDEVDDPEKTKKNEIERLIQEEKSEEGNVKLSVFLAYCKSLGQCYSVFLFVTFTLYQCFSIWSNIWLSQWTDDPLMSNTSITNTSFYSHRRSMYLGVYGGLGFTQAFFVLCYAILSAISMVRAAGVLHKDMLRNIIRSPMAFFDTTPIGRILNRFSRDVETIDTVLPELIVSFLDTVFSVLSTIIVISYSSPIFLSVVVPLGLFYYFIQRFYIPTSRQLKRIESTTRSPIYANFSETITGASTIRAFAAQDRFSKRSEDLVDHNLVYYFASIASNRWIGFRLDLVGALIVVAAALFAVLGRGTVGSGIVGLSISYALEVTGALNWMVRMTTELETNVVSIERVLEYTTTPTEAVWYKPETRPPNNWPQSGEVDLVSYATRYRPELDLVLRGISVKVNSGEKVGIVGRTGAGKSSLTLALFRIIEAAGGRIIIDDVEISKLGLHDLRSNITILPQDPVLFSGSLRMNLDPFDQYTDDLLWTAIEHAHLKDFVSSLPAKLTYEVGEGGQNLSVGQRQLVCLARTLLRKTKILILDEATAAVDLETDKLIQDTIRKEFADCTILTIAHRLNTILDSDRVLVLSEGLVKEFEKPSVLLEDKTSIFYGMAKDAGLTS